MLGQFEKATLEVQYNDGSEKTIKQSFANLKEGVSPEELSGIHAAISDIAAYPTGDLTIVERTRYTTIGG